MLMALPVLLFVRIRYLYDDMSIYHRDIGVCSRNLHASDLSGRDIYQHLVLSLFGWSKRILHEFALGIDAGKDLGYRS